MFEIYQGIIGSILELFLKVWWLVLPIVLFAIFWHYRLIYIRTRYVNAFSWRTFELKVPREILKTPKAMEQVFSAIYSIYSRKNNLEKYWDGEVQRWISFEMVGFGGGVYFYLQVPYSSSDSISFFDFRNLVESAIYSQYPDAELHEVEDYTDLMPSILPNEIYNIWGADLVLAEDNYLPIKTYSQFEEIQEEKRLDPIAAITEVMSNLKEGEIIWLQFLISPLGGDALDEYKKAGEAKISEIVGRKLTTPKGGPLTTLWDWAKNFLIAPVELPTWPGSTKGETTPTIKFLSPDEQDTVKAIANKISKLAFETVIRFIYIDRRDSFTPLNIAAVKGAFFQFNTHNLNAFKFGKAITHFDSVLARIIPRYKEIRALYKKRKIFNAYREKRFGKYNHIREEKFPILNTEELATIYHVPAIMVEAPKLRRLEAKKGEPPAGLPIE
ncbi:MAG: hypothetical protein AAB651_01105 [Patescibacteria group bacterium]